MDRAQSPARHLEPLLRTMTITDNIIEKMFVLLCSLEETGFLARNYAENPAPLAQLLKLVVKRHPYLRDRLAGLAPHHYGLDLDPASPYSVSPIIYSIEGTNDQISRYATQVYVYARAQSARSLNYSV